MFFKAGSHEDLARAIMELYHDRQKGKALAQNAYKKFEKLRWSKTKGGYLSCVYDLLG